ncbi:phospholipase A2 inhibitor subunit gamma B-like [Myripristis murdjan]|uniref:phospholipase A2 inhibitor subunit gamma B-like n=1 Tax=Myripristis murdjan TaxID=586833 RepID=UPI0011760342|nr:phospholipase A2 inhibitor and Ly6/PLAUR domain-containing protein [Myripristis murdjan]
MQLLPTLCLTWALLHTAECLRCHQCVDTACSNTTSVLCPTTSTVCRTLTSVVVLNSVSSVSVVKSCSSPEVCATPGSMEAELSVNLGAARQAHTQLCCTSDNCNFQTLAVPSTATNGKLCSSCRNATDSVEACNATLSCQGAENSCFSGTAAQGSGLVALVGCMSKNLCTNIVSQKALLGSGAKLVCGAPWSVRVSAALLAAALTAWKVLV